MSDIVTAHIYPPIPDRSYDWSAHFDDYDGAPDAGWQCTGSGRTEFEAVRNLYENWEERHDKPLVASRTGFDEDLGICVK